jgi:deoxyribose-phosphate aldolase
MSFNQNLNEVLEHLLLKPSEIISNEQMLHCIDLTLLDQNASKESLVALGNLANTHQVAAVCVFSNDLTDFNLKKPIKLATVVNFPQGNEDVATCLTQIEHAIRNGVEEIDYVVPYSLYLEGKRNQALQHAKQIVGYCKERKLGLKIILETAAFSNLNILHELARELIEMKIDFLKTSTGKIKHGASLAAVFTLLSAIKDSGNTVGIKISGGIKTPLQARNYAHLSQLILQRPLNSSWFRIGASSLVEELIKIN